MINIIHITIKKYSYNNKCLIFRMYYSEKIEIIIIIYNNNRFIYLLYSL